MFIAVKLETTGSFDRNLKKSYFLFQRKYPRLSFENLHFSIPYLLLVVKKFSMVVTPSITLRIEVFILFGFPWTFSLFHRAGVASFIFVGFPNESYCHNPSFQYNVVSKNSKLFSRFSLSHRAGVASYSIQKVKKEDMTSTNPGIQDSEKGEKVMIVKSDPYSKGQEVMTIVYPPGAKTVV